MHAQDLDSFFPILRRIERKDPNVETSNNKTEKTFSPTMPGKADLLNLQCTCNAPAMQRTTNALPMHLQCTCNAPAMHLQCTCNAPAIQMHDLLPQDQVTMEISQNQFL